MRVQCPPDTCGVSIGGQEFAVDKNGVIELPDDGNHFSLLPAGFSVIADEAKTKKAAAASTEAPQS